MRTTSASMLVFSKRRKKRPEFGLQQAAPYRDETVWPEPTCHAGQVASLELRATCDLPRRLRRDYYRRAETSSWGELL
jgi:hypothetical protein